MHRRLRRFYAQMVGPGDLCFDIGANVGNRVAVFRSLGARVIALEPQPNLAAYLRARYLSRVTIVEAAAGESTGSAALYLSSSHTVATMSRSFVQEERAGEWIGPDHRWSQKIVVPVLTVDSLIEQHGLPRFMKIDVEGFEPKVLAGLSRPIPWVSFEHTPWLPEVAEQCLERLLLIGDYDFRFSEGETFEWSLPRFGTAEEVLTTAISGGWGEIYARLR